ncbi:MAG: MCE family protein, partial [Mycobacterium sp.]|nr:MCE family protein [Mycobacterium sp.]
LVMDPGSKVTFNGVQIGRVAEVNAIEQDGTTKAQLKLDVDPRYVRLIPANVEANIQATTVFGNKYVSFTSPKNPDKARISPADTIDVSTVTTEFNTLFETITAISEQVDPVNYPDNLPRVNARGGPGGAPGCWQSITKELWPAPYLVMDTGASIAPYNHWELGQPILTEYVWGRQGGENTINP